MQINSVKEEIQKEVFEEPQVAEGTLLDFGESPKKPKEPEKTTSVPQNDKLLFDLDADFQSNVNVTTSDNLLDVQPTQPSGEFDLLGGFGSSDPFGAKPHQEEASKTTSDNFSDPFALFQSSTAQPEIKKPAPEKTQSSFGSNFDPFGISAPKQPPVQSKQPASKPPSNDNFDPFSNLSWNAPSSGGNLQSNKPHESKTSKAQGSMFTASQPKKPNYSSAAFNTTSSGWKSSKHYLL